MKRVIKILGIVLIVVVASVLALIGYLNIAFPKVAEAQEMSIESTPERMARGEHLFNDVMMCRSCHSDRDFNHYAGPFVDGTTGKGGKHWSREEGLPGDIYAPNITPWALGEWSDGELYRAITAGVNRDGEPLFPLMPWQAYAKADPEDIRSVIVYLRSLDPIENEVERTSLDFPVNLIARTLPADPTMGELPSTNDELAYGKYLCEIAACSKCHTPMANNEPDASMYLAGGFPFPMKTGGTAFSANITPCTQSGIGNWSRQQFIDRFKIYASDTYVPGKVEKNSMNSEMPWQDYARMSDEELGAIYSYLMSIDPITNKVTKFVAR